jgi:hypothetical protein
VEVVKYTNGEDANTLPGAIISVPNSGATVTWTYTVTNTGNLTLQNVVVTDASGNFSEFSIQESL